MVEEARRGGGVLGGGGADDPEDEFSEDSEGAEEGVTEDIAAMEVEWEEWEEKKGGGD